MLRKNAVRFTALGYLLIVLLGPLSMLFWRIYVEGVGRARNNTVSTAGAGPPGLRAGTRCEPGADQPQSEAQLHAYSLSLATA